MNTLPTEINTYYDQHEFDKVIGLLGTPEKAASLTEEEGLMLCRSYISTGEYQKALETATNLLAVGYSDEALTSIVNSYKPIIGNIEAGIQQIIAGEHSSNEIHFLRDYIGRLIEHKAYWASIHLLHRLSEARKAKTTNVLWIGQHLKEVYFAEGAQHLKGKFNDKLLLDEIIFYYLKACKLFEPGYKEVQGHLKKLKSQSAD